MQTNYVNHFNESIFNQLLKSNYKLDNRIKTVQLEKSDLIIGLTDDSYYMIYNEKSLEDYYKRRYISFNDYVIIQKIILSNIKQNN